jgi:hypothetical protein
MNSRAPQWCGWIYCTCDLNTSGAIYRHGANTERSAQQGNAVTVEIKSPEKMSGWLKWSNLGLMASQLTVANFPFLMSAFIDNFNDIHQFEVLLPILKPQGVPQAMNLYHSIAHPPLRTDVKATRGPLSALSPSLFLNSSEI